MVGWTKVAMDIKVNLRRIKKYQYNHHNEIFQSELKQSLNKIIVSKQYKQPKRSKYYTTLGQPKLSLMMKRLLEALKDHNFAVSFCNSTSCR